MKKYIDNGSIRLDFKNMINGLQRVAPGESTKFNGNIRVVGTSRSFLGHIPRSGIDEKTFIMFHVHDDRA